MSMKIPKKIKVGGITYDVRIQDDWMTRGESDGQRFYDSDIGNVIFIAEHLSPEAKVTTLIHEVLHCMNSTMNHEFLDSLAEQLYAFLVDNNLLCKKSGDR